MLLVGEIPGGLENTTQLATNGHEIEGLKVCVWSSKILDVLRLLNPR